VTLCYHFDTTDTDFAHIESEYMSFIVVMKQFVKNYRARNGFNVQCDFIPYNNHKIMSYKYLCFYKARAVLENYNFLYN